MSSFKEKVVDLCQVAVAGSVLPYRTYLETVPATSRNNDEANAVDNQFARYVLEWLGFTASDWTYNQTVDGSKQDKPDYVVNGTVGKAFIWEDKNSSLDLEDKHIQQMRRYSVGTAGYAVWCNMRRILAVRFVASDTSRYDMVTDVDVLGLFGSQQLTPDELARQQENLSLLHLLFSKERFTSFGALAAKIAVDETTFKEQATDLTTPVALNAFIVSSRQSLDHLKLAALTQIRDAVQRGGDVETQIVDLRQEWKAAADAFVAAVGHQQEIVRAALDALVPGESDRTQLEGLERVAAQARGAASLPATLRGAFEQWQEKAVRINSAFRSLRFERTTRLRVAEAYRTWSLRQRDPEDVSEAVFAEQVGYVFFVRMLLVRVLEDKGVLSPRIASDGGFQAWLDYLQRHFSELDGVSVLNENFVSLLSRKAGAYYLHFFQQPVFDWFVPDDFLLIETLEFLCRYNFHDVASDVIGFTYEEYITRRARNRKGHFLTRPEVVEYMLDVLGYKGREIIGRPILDPACGSGSFLVHAAQRYRQACVSSLCAKYRLPEDEAVLVADAPRRVELAREFLKGLTSNFFGMEINPFACYLAEMNLLIQSLDDLGALRSAGEEFTIERFSIFNTNSLDMPSEVLAGRTLTAAPASLSERMGDEAFTLKGLREGFSNGFYYLIFNPPYVSGRQEPLNLTRLRSTSFYEEALSGDTNLYLMFLRLGAHYLSQYGRMVFIVPLTIFGDASARAARRLLRTTPLTPSAAIRFYRGDVLFPGVDQAVGIVRVEKSRKVEKVLVSGGNTVEEVRANEFAVPLAQVIDAVPVDAPWNGAWLVTSDEDSVKIWQHACAVSDNLHHKLEGLLSSTFTDKQGDVNANALNSLRTGSGSSATGHIAIYKGESIEKFGVLPLTPSDWALAQPLQQNTSAANRTLHQIKNNPSSEAGLVRREVARLNTRERLLATWFTRTSHSPIAFTHETWRYVLRANVTEEKAKALLAVLNSKPVAYLLNLFSSNNHVGKTELGRVPTPAPATLPIAKLAALADQLLNNRRTITANYVQRLGAVLPELDSGSVYVPPHAVLQTLPLPKVTVANLVARGTVRMSGPENRQVQVLQSRGAVGSTLDAADANAEPFAAVLTLYLEEAARGKLTWSNIKSWQMPEPDAGADFSAAYQFEAAQANQLQAAFAQGMLDLDEAVSDWYDFAPELRPALRAGLPWARRRAEAVEPAEDDDTGVSEAGLVFDAPLPRVALATASSLIYATGYDAARQILDVELQSGDVYRYETVPPSVVEAFQTANSPGTFYNESVKGQYPSQMITAGTEAVAE